MTVTRLTGVCCCCRREHRLTRAGRVWAHTQYGTAQPGGQTPLCPGAGEPPSSGTLALERAQEIDQLLADTDQLLARLDLADSTTGEPR